MSETNTRILWEKEAKRTVPSDGIKMVLEFHVVIDPSKLAGVSRNNGYDETIVPCELVQVLGKTSHNLFAGLLANWKPNKGFKYGNLYADNSAVTDLNELGSAILRQREPEPPKSRPTKTVDTSLSFDSIGAQSASEKTVSVSDKRFDLIKTYHAPKAREAKQKLWDKFLADNWGEQAGKIREVFHAEFLADESHGYDYILGKIGDKCKVSPFSEDVYKGLLLELSQ